MSFTTSIQALLGANTPDNTGNHQCCPDWVNFVCYIYGSHPTLSETVLAVQNMHNGSELRSQNANIYDGGRAASGFPIGQDTYGNLYVIGSAGLPQINSTTLLQIQDQPVPFIAAGGVITGLQATDATGWVMVGGGTFTAAYYVVKVSDESLWAPGTISLVNRVVQTCAGIPNTGIGWALVGPLTSGDTQVLDLHKVNVNTGVQGDTVIGHVHPTDVDAGWTQIYGEGICTDQTDGNLLVALSGQNGATNQYYFAKFSASNASVIWKTAMPGLSGADMMQYSSVKHQRFNWVSNQGGGAGLEQTFVDTSTGAIIHQYTTGLSNLLIFGGGGWASNDDIGGALLFAGLTAGAGGPVLLNSTPSAFQGWAIVYVENSPAPVGSRRFLAECGPVRVLT